jgi:hypothetical protein
MVAIYFLVRYEIRGHVSMVERSDTNYVLYSATVSYTFLWIAVTVVEQTLSLDRT